MIKHFLFLFFVLWITWSGLEAQELPFVYYTSNNEINPLPSALVTNVYQDKDGFIWISAFSSGLIRFDGARMELYDQQDGLKDLEIWQVIQDGAGHLWVSSNAGLVVSEEPIDAYKLGRRVKFTSDFGGITLIGDALNLNQMTLDNAGRIWVGTNDHGIFIYHIEQGISLNVTPIPTDIMDKGSSAVKSLGSINDGSVLVGLEGGLLVKFTDKNSELLFGPQSGTNRANFQALFEDQDHQVWAYKENGEVVLFRTLDEKPTKLAQLQPSNFADITSFADNSIWVSNGASGITKFNQKTGEPMGSYLRANGLLSDNVFQVYRDREGNMWVAQSGGISKLRFNYNSFENFSARSVSGEAPVLPSARVNSILITDKGLSPCRFWVGTEGGATCVNEQGFSLYLTQSDGLTGDWVNGLGMDPRGRIFIATTQGLNAIVFDRKDILEEAYDIRNIDLFGKPAILFSIQNSPPFLAAENLSIQISSKQNHIETIWFPGLRSLYGVVQNKIYQFGSESGLPSSIYKSVGYDDEGYLWVGTIDKGLYKSTEPITLDYLQAKKPEDNNDPVFKLFWSKENGAPTNHIEKLLWNEGKLWVGTQEGLFAINNETSEIIHRLSSENGLPTDNAISFAHSLLTGNFWVGTNAGLAEVDPQNAQVLRTVTRQNGLIDNEVWLYGSVKVGLDGQVFYGTANGLSIYDPLLDRPNTIPPKLQLTTADISYQSKGRNEVTFEYAALSFANVSGVRYKTRLIGYEDNWSEETNVNRLRYTNLPAFFLNKSYTLEVIAINESGVESEQALRYTFFIQPIVWLRWWTILIYMAVFIITIYIIDKYQRSRLIKKERDNARIREAELHAETSNARSLAAEAQAQALKADNEKKALELEKIRELERAYNELKTTQNRLIQSEKMASMGRLATGIAHEIKNPLNFINNFSEVLVELVHELEEALKSDDMEEVDYIMNQLKENTRRIEKHGKKADSIVLSLMQHAQGTRSNYEMFDLKNLVEKYADLAYNGKRVHVHNFYTNMKFEVEPNLPQVNIVVQEIGQVLLNVIGNSLDAIWSKKVIQNGTYDPEITIAIYRNGDFEEIKISDNGPGIPDEIKERIFEPFFTTKPTGEATGLGLSLCYDIITQGHNGSLRLENKDDEGATFVIALPIR